MPPRQQVNTNLGTVQRTPAAQPVDAFERPAESSAIQLAKSLRGFRSSLDQFTGVKNAQWRAGEIDEATAQAEMLSEFENYQAAVDAGFLKGTETPIFKQTFNERKGRIAGQRYQADVMERYQDQVLPSITEDTDINAVVAQFRHEFLGDEPLNDAFVVGFSQIASSVESGVVSRFREDRHKALKAEAEQDISIELRQSVLAARANLVDGQRVADVINLTDIERRQGVLTGSELNDLMTDTVTTLAVELRDETILDVLLKDRADGTKGPGTTQRGRAQMENARNRIQNLEIAEWNLKNSEAAYQNRQQQQATVLAAAERLDENPYADLRDLLVDNPESASLVSSLQNAIVNQETRRDQGQLGRAWLDVYRGITTDPVEIMNRVVAAGGNAADVKNTVGLLESRRKEIANDPYQSYLNTSITRLRELVSGETPNSAMSAAIAMQKSIALGGAPDFEKTDTLHAAEVDLVRAYHAQMQAWQNPQDGSPPQQVYPDMVHKFLLEQVEAISQMYRVTPETKAKQ